LKKAYHYVDLLEQENAKFHRNLAQIQADGNSLHLTEAREKYLRAKRAQELHIKKNEERQRTLMDLISRVERMLKMSRDKKWPLGQPKESFQPAPSPTNSQPDLCSTEPQMRAPAAHPSWMPPCDIELENLITLGPLQKNATNEKRHS
jgi:hypothetical protein